MITKEDIERVLVFLEDMNLLHEDHRCGICHYEDMCDEHVKCPDGIATFIFREMKQG